MAKLKLYETIESKLPTLTKTNGNLIVARDTKSLYMDLNGDRFQIADYVDVKTHDDLISTLTPLANKFYYVTDTKKLYRYINGSWQCLNELTKQDVVNALGYTPPTKDTITTISTTTGSGNAVTNITANDGQLTLVKDKTFSVDGHIHDDRYYTEPQVDTLLSNKLESTPTLDIDEVDNPEWTESLMSMRESIDDLVMPINEAKDRTMFAYDRHVEEIEIPDMDDISRLNESITDIADIGYSLIFDGKSETNYNGWATGAISNSDGTTILANNARMHSNQYKFVPVGTSITHKVIPGYMYMLHWYDDRKIYMGSTEWIATSSHTITPIQYPYVRISGRKSDSSIITDVTTGENIVLLFEIADRVAPNVENSKCISIEMPTWRQGVYSITDGKTITNSTTRIVNETFYAIHNDTILENKVIPKTSTYMYMLFWYDSKKNLVDRTDWLGANALHSIVAVYPYFRIQMAKINGSAIVAEDGLELRLYVRDKSYVIQDIKWKIGSLVPNAGIDNPTSTTKISSNFIRMGKGSKVSCKNSDYNHLVYKYDVHFNYIENGSWSSDDITFDEDCYIRVLVRANPDRGMSTSDLEKMYRVEDIYFGYPDYSIDGNSVEYPLYYTEEVRTSVERAREYIGYSGRNQETFIYASDLHRDVNPWGAPKMIDYIKRYLGIKNTFIGGDLLDIEDTSVYAQNLLCDVVSDLNSTYGDTYFVRGNHDDNRYAPAVAHMTRNQCYACIMYPQINKTDGDYLFNFYFDNPVTKTRFLILDSVGEPNDGYYMDFSPLTKSWIENNALASTPEDYKIIVFTHIMYNSNTWSESALPDSLYLTNSGAYLKSICDSFNRNSQNGAKVIALFTGHIHYDYDAGYTDTGIPIITIDCGGSSTYMGTYQVGTKNAEAFDIVTVDFSNKRIVSTRVGRGNDRIWDIRVD